MDTPESRDTPDANELDRLRGRVAKLERAKRELEEAQVLLQRDDEADHRFAENLATLVEITNELAMAESVDDLCRHAVELGRSRLGFDRLGIWFRTDEPDVIAGSFGVDFNGQLCDERGERTRVNPDDPDGRVLLSKEPLVLVGEAPLLNARGETVGRGSQVFAALWDGKKVIGHVSADNRVLNRPIDQQHCELLRLFGSSIGNLCSRKRIEEERELLIRELQDALAHIKTLHGLIPICANCKKVRDDHGYWQRIEIYLRDHSDADFSHGLCPECMETLYPDLVRDESHSDS
ncbi:MAG: GAF domain-containing protein [bacterium]|nr:GAF domain-containing protein [bacterium]